jgi:DNA repair protein RadC
VTYTVAREQGPTSWPALSSPDAAAEFARELLAAHDDDREHFWAIFLNAQNGYTGHHLVSTGSLSASIVHPREVLGPALREGAAHLILVHNHPSGDPTPSKEDVSLTRQLVEGARLLGIRLQSSTRCPRSPRTSGPSRQRWPSPSSSRPCGHSAV